MSSIDELWLVGALRDCIVYDCAPYRTVAKVDAEKRTVGDGDALWNGRRCCMLLAYTKRLLSALYHYTHAFVGTIEKRTSRPAYLLAAQWVYSKRDPRRAQKFYTLRKYSTVFLGRRRPKGSAYTDVN